MSHETLNLSIPSERHFMVAKATIPMNHRGDISVDGRDGYNVVYYEYKSGEKITNKLHPPENLKRGIYTIYWIHSGDTYTLDVPWGFRVTDTNSNSFAVNGSVQILIHASIGELQEIFPLSWYEEYRGGIKYEYLLDYYIDNAGAQQGLSIFFRSRCVEKFKQALANIPVLSDESIRKVITETARSFDDQQSSFGDPIIAMSSVSINIISLNAGGQDHAE